ncbi:hypothetical protein COE81_16575 [Bacillus wiedmannii]|nr:hypothetical protein CN552_19375 [Bacillus wiedmannii]PHB05800.1 hypothetical protein COE81_16575 [Bacillus wiedmannii]
MCGLFLFCFVFLSINRYLMSNRRYIEKIVDIFQVMNDIFEKSLKYISCTVLKLKFISIISYTGTEFQYIFPLER